MDDNMLYQDSSTNGSSRGFSVRQTQEEFKYYFYYVLFKRKRLVISVAIIGIIATVVGLYLCTPLHKATSKILVRSNVSQEVILFNDLYRRPATVTNSIPANNFIEIATSHAIARTIVERFNLDEKLKHRRENPENLRDYIWYGLRGTKDVGKTVIKFPYKIVKKLITGEYPADEEKDYTAMAIKQFTEEMTQIDLVPESDIINLTIWDESPKEAEAIVKALTNEVIKQSVSMEQNAAGYGYAFARKELEKARQELMLAEERVHAFKEKWDISKIDTQKEIKLSELDTIEKRLIEINADLSAQKAKLAEGKEQLNQQKKSLTSLQAHRDLLNDAILLEVEISALEAQKENYESARANVKGELQNLVEKELTLTRLDREAELKADLFDQLGTKHDELSVQSVSNLGGFDLRIIDTPELRENVEADYPIWEMGLGFGIPASIIIAIIFAFFLELFNESFWIGDQVENKLGIPLLGTVKFYDWQSEVR